MKLTWVLLSLLALSAPLGAGAFAYRRFEARRAHGEDHARRRMWAIATTALGALFFVPALLAERFVRAWTGLDQNTAMGADVAALVYMFFVAAPIEQGLKVAAIVPVWRSKHLAAPLDGLVYAAAAALGFGVAKSAALVIERGALPFDAARSLLAPPAHMFFAAAWGYVLGRAKQKRRGRAEGRRVLGGRTFNLVWFGAMVSNGIYDYIVFARGPLALIATAPILLVMGVSAFVLVRAEKSAARPTPLITKKKRSVLPPIAPPSLRSMRDALWRSERPVMIRWIAFGALVTTGVMTGMLVAAVVVGHRMGIDFAAVDRGDTGTMAGVTPLLLLGGAALAAFPVAGYLVARASATHTVLEPAISAILAIMGTLILLGLASPIAVVFALGFVPVAFALACFGAWLGITRPE